MRKLIVVALAACVVGSRADAQCSGDRSDAHPHAVYNGKSWFPEPGYAWVNPNDENNLSVYWQPGKPYSCNGERTFPNVIASVNEGKWRPAPGYHWVKVDEDGHPPPGELQVDWAPGSSYWYLDELRYPNIVAGDKVDDWYPKPGYDWVQRDSNGRGILGSYSVYWKPGMGYFDRGVAKWPHVQASVTEGQWYPAPGYRWANLDENGKARDFSVHWDSGMTYRYLGRDFYPHVHSSADEGFWLHDAGYDWLYRDDNGRPIPDRFFVISEALLQRWSRYLREIQTDSAYANWPAPPYDAFIARGGPRATP